MEERVVGEKEEQENVGRVGRDGKEVRNTRKELVEGYIMKEWQRGRGGMVSKF